MSGKPRPKKPGPKTALNNNLFMEIKRLILEGRTLREIAEIKGLNESTLYIWHSDNYLNLKDKIEGWKRDRKLMLAEKNIEEFLEMSDIQSITYVNKKGTSKTVSGRDSQLTRVKADISKFVAETLGKDNYSKRSEVDARVKVDVDEKAKEQANKAINSFLNENTRDTTIGEQRA